MEIIGRSKEIKEFKRILISEKSEFLVVYGRRRIGKTFLIREYFKNQFSYYITGLPNATKKQQLDNFYTILLNNFTFKKNDKKSNNWLGAFEHLKQHLSKQTKRKRSYFLMNCHG